jgi:hypothetical protein
MNPANKVLQTNDMGNTNNTTHGRFEDVREKQWHTNIGQETEDHTPCYSI